MAEITRDNHYVAQAYLRRWARANQWIWSFRTLVSGQNVPLWALHSVKGVAFMRDLYTSTEHDAESEKNERWISDGQMVVLLMERLARYDRPLRRRIWLALNKRSACCTLSACSCPLHFSSRSTTEGGVLALVAVW